MKKKFMTAIAVAALAVSTLGTTAFAAEAPAEGDTIAVDDIKDLAPGVYDVDASLKCYISAMGGIDFGEGMVTDATVEVDAEGNVEVRLALAPTNGVIYTIPYSAFIYAADSKPVYLDGSEWKDAVYTLSDKIATGSNGKGDVNYVDTLGFEISEVADTYSLGFYLDSNFMGIQFGGPTPGTNSAGTETYHAILNVDWDNVSVEKLYATDTLESGTYAVDISWSPMAGMFQPILDVNADDMTFKVYNASAVDTIKGSGTIAFDETTGEYTLTYTDAKNAAKNATTTFTYDADKDEVTFTSPLYSNGVSYNRTENDVFVPYTAKVTTLSTDNGEGSGTGTGMPEAGDNTNIDSNTNAGTTTGNNTTTTTSPKTGDTTSPAWMIVACAAAAAVVGAAAKKRTIA